MWYLPKEAHVAPISDARAVGAQATVVEGGTRNDHIFGRIEHSCAHFTRCRGLVVAMKANSALGFDAALKSCITAETTAFN
jgi:hypothetical protein